MPPKVGDRYVLEDMQRLGAVIGGEESGHMIFLDHHTTGDGILTALQLIAAMIKENKPLSELARMMEVFPQKLINVPVKSKPDFPRCPRWWLRSSRPKRKLGDRGRVLVRYSGTQNACRVMVEGPTDELTQKYANRSPMPLKLPWVISNFRRERKLSPEIRRSKMPIRVIVTRDFDHMSKVAGDIVKQDIVQKLKRKKEYVLGLATGNSPTGVYRHLARQPTPAHSTAAESSVSISMNTWVCPVQMRSNA